MKTIGLLGGMSWESTALYYAELNRGVAQALGGLHSARIAMVSVDFEAIEALQRAGRWEEAGAALAADAEALERAGADFVVLCTNTMHKVAPAIEAAIGVPLLHIADATGRALVAAGHRRVGLLGTRFTMEGGFYRDRLVEGFGLEVIVPGPAERDLVHGVIYDELCLGHALDASRDAFAAIIARLADDGAEAVILGCTEIGMLVTPERAALPVFDTTAIHAAAAVTRALE